MKAPSDDSVNADSGRGFPRVRMLLLPFGLVVLVAWLLKAFVVSPYYIPSGSMEPTLLIGERVLGEKISLRWAGVSRGDVVVFDGRGSFLPAEAPRGLLSGLREALGFEVGEGHTFIKRVVGIPGDHVRCCNSRGQMVVNGVAIDEGQYLYAGDVPSTTRFDVIVPKGRIWVMGDHRSESADSRSHLGDPGGGMVSQSRVEAIATAVIWPVSRLRKVEQAEQLAAVPGGNT